MIFFLLTSAAAVAGTALDDAVLGTLLLPGAGKPHSVDLWPIFHTGVPNFPPYQLATGKSVPGQYLTRGAFVISYYSHREVVL
jgi:hypothetical protein